MSELVGTGRSLSIIDSDESTKSRLLTNIKLCTSTILVETGTIFSLAHSNLGSMYVPLMESVFSFAQSNLGSMYMPLIGSVFSFAQSNLGSKRLNVLPATCCTNFGMVKTD